MAGSPWNPPFMNSQRITHNRRTSSGFTLIELLAVVAIVGVLAALVILTVGRSRSAAYRSKCLISIRSAYTASQLYSADNRGELVPGSTEIQGDSSTTALWPEKLFPYYGETTNGGSATFACPKWEDDKVSATAYNWGYAMNITPGFEGASSNSAQKKTNMIVKNTSGAVVSGQSFRWAGITHPAKRLYFCDSYQWHVRGTQVSPGTPGGTLAAYDRHGESKCNVVFFDGHTASLTPAEVDQAIYDPAAPATAVN